MGRGQKQCDLSYIQEPDQISKYVKRRELKTNGKGVRTMERDSRTNLEMLERMEVAHELSVSIHIVTSKYSDKHVYLFLSSVH